MMMRPSTKPLWRLEDLLVVCFQPDELHRSLVRVFPGLTAELPLVQSPPVQFVHGAVALLERHGCIEAPFFAHVLQLRPLRRSQILSVASALSVDTSVVEALCEGDVTHVFRLPAAPDPTVVDTLEELLIERARCSLDDPQRGALAEDIERIAAQLRTRRPPRAGDRVAGTILEYVLGHGTFGSVWRSHDEASGAPRATKIFDPSRLTDGIMVWRFRQGVRALQALGRYRGAPESIPGIFTVADDGLSFAMEYLPGNTLERIAERRWTIEQKIAVFSEICGAIAFAHRAGVIHRDIKPNNVMFRTDSSPVVIDFDIADVHFLTEQNLTVGGLGNMMFAAPEQLECAGEADERADVFSLGRILLYILIERVPSLQDRGVNTTHHPHIPPSLLQVVQKATLQHPQDRYASVRQLWREVEAYKTGWSACRAHVRRSLAWTRRNAAFVAFSLSGTFGSLVYAQQQEEHASETRRVNAAMKAQAEQIDTLQLQLSEVQVLQEDLQRRLYEARDQLTRIESRLLEPVTSAKRGELMVERQKLESEITNLEHDLWAVQGKLRTLQQQMGRSIDELKAAGEGGAVAMPVLPIVVPETRRVASSAEKTEEVAEVIRPTAPPVRSRARKVRLLSVPERNAQVEATLHRMESGLKKCRDRQTKRWARITVSFVVGANGRVLKFKISPSDKVSEAASECVESNVRRLRFDSSTQQTPHFFPMNFA
jgi:serine/threonine protein kinase